MVRIFATLMILALCNAAMAAPLALSPKDVADLILKQSFRAQEINLNSQLSRLQKEVVEGAYQYSLAFDSGYENSKFESASNTYLLRNEFYTTNFSLKKPFSSGTNVSLLFSRESSRPEYASTSPNPANRSTVDTVGIILSQNLLSNFFGRADRADLRSAEQNHKASQIDRVTQLQNLVLSAIRAYWSAYVSQETFQEALNSRNRYQKLVEQIKKKTGYGYSSPGELAQAQAALEVREQNVKRSSVDYLAAMDVLATLLRLPAGTEIKFQISEEIPLPPEAKPVVIADLRTSKVFELRSEAAQNALIAAGSRNYPDVSLVGKVYQQGLEENANDSYSEMTGGAHPKYYVGVQLNYTFGSGLSDEIELNRKASKDLAEALLQRSRLELKDREADLIRRLQSTYAIAISARAQKGFSEKAAVDLSKSYTQGRTDISVLINSLNGYFDAEVSFTKALGDYQTTLNEWAAFRDELIKVTRDTETGERRDVISEE